MILERLKEFWDSQPNSVRPGYQRVLLTKHVDLDSDGNVRSIIPLTGEGSKVRDGKKFEVPREQPQRTSGVRARLVHDNGRYVLGLMGEGDKPDRVAQAHQAFVDLLDKAHETTGSALVASVVKWVRTEGAREKAMADGVDANDDLYITVNGADPTQSDALASFWNQPSDKAAVSMRCLVTGELAEVGKAMPYPIKRIPAGQMSGNMLVSVNFNAAQSYGLEGNLNSPISKDAAEAICNALNLLTGSAEHKLTVGDTLYLYWLRSDQERDALKALKTVEPEEVDPKIARYKHRKRQPKPRTSSVGASIEAPTTGARVTADPLDFVVLGVTANASRIAIREYHELTLPQLDDRIGEWFSKLELHGVDGKPLPRPRLDWLSYCAFREKSDMPKRVPVQLMASALHGTPLPDSLLSTAVRRNVIEQGPYATYNKVRRMSYNRLALIKACLVPFPYDPENDPLSALNQTHPSPAYHCGRLLAVIDNIQRAYFRADGREINRTVVDRHYGSASTAPGVSLGPLLADATHAHFGKLQRNAPKTYRALEKELREVLENLQEFPSTLNHHEQGLFALGFYHQRTYTISQALARKKSGVADEATEALIDTELIETSEEEA